MSIDRRQPGLILVKLGGSLITDKQRDAHARHAVVARLARELAQGVAGGQPVIVGHGSGSFGHVAARKHGLASRRLGNAPALAAAAVRRSAAELHGIVTGAFVDSGVPAWSWAPSNVMLARRGRPASANLEPLSSALAVGMVPVTYGDVVVDRDWRASICSTEAVLSYLVRRLLKRGVAVSRVLWLGDTDGIYDQHGETVPEITDENVVASRRVVAGSAGTDVTGGMLLRLRTARDLARLGVESWIVDGQREGLLADGLRGAPLPGTRVVAG
ncbi:MAG: isopentenyl phosphate kinase [Thermoanaerobaculia bacterium]|nr:isopentenyl phosphate kinase [Thermoanaerobaculia bacterium]